MDCRRGTFAKAAHPSEKHSATAALQKQHFRRSTFDDSTFAKTTDSRSPHGGDTMGRFDGTVALITGASRGIGFSVAERLVSEGAKVVLTARGEDALRDAASRLGPAGTALWVAGKADDGDHRAEVFDLIAREFGGLDFFVNNAGTNPAYGSLLDIEPRAMQKILDVNVLAAVDWSRDAVRNGFRSAGGAIVNISSIAGVSAAPGIGFYGVSKAALISITTQLAFELAPSIRVNAVAPAVIKTDFAKALYEGRESEVAAEYPLKRLGNPEDVAGAVAFLLSKDSAWITGQTIVIDGGASLRPMA
jgi:NAD(P)-dependent dehydrogenase (short-subunit alcohol dehydrogenase family)